jgi:hypothetical protein
VCKYGGIPCRGEDRNGEMWGGGSAQTHQPAREGGSAPAWRGGRRWTAGGPSGFLSPGWYRVPLTGVRLKLLRSVVDGPRRCQVSAPRSVKRYYGRSEFVGRRGKVCRNAASKPARKHLRRAVVGGLARAGPSSQALLPIPTERTAACIRKTQPRVRPLVHPRPQPPRMIFKPSGAALSGGGRF